MVTVAESGVPIVVPFPPLTSVIVAVAVFLRKYL
jgi:hypothetical protein